MRGRMVQGVNGSSRMQRMCRRHVFNTEWDIDMPELFARLLVANGKLKLHLQCGLLGA